jgi:hypothetical protein
MSVHLRHGDCASHISGLSKPNRYAVKLTAFVIYNCIEYANRQLKTHWTCKNGKFPVFAHWGLEFAEQAIGSQLGLPGRGCSADKCPFGQTVAFGSFINAKFGLVVH